MSCSNCGAKLEHKDLGAKETPENPVVSEPIPDTSRLSGVGIEKFLAPGEHIVYITPSLIWYAN